MTSDGHRAWRRERRNADLGVWPTTVATRQGERLADASDLPALLPLPPVGPMAPRRVRLRRRIPWRTLAIAGWALAALLIAVSAHAQTVILYSRHDAEDARRARVLAAAFGPVFSDADLRPGQPWRTVIAGRVCAARLVLVLWSAPAAASPEVGAEWRHALACGRRVVPVMLDDTPMPGELGARQGVDWRR